MDEFYSVLTLIVEFSEPNEVNYIIELEIKLKRKPVDL